jgi:hypothetical protein
MLEVPSALGFVVHGLKSNLFGLGCPFYCTAPSLGSYLAFFLLGLVLGFAACAWLLVRFDLFPSSASTSTACPGPRLPLVSPQLVEPDLPCLATCMSTSHGAVTETSLDFPGLRVVVSGSPDKVADFLRFVAGFSPSRPRSPDPSVGSFEVVSEAPSSAVSTPGVGLRLETRAEIAASFLGCPERFVALGVRLTGSALSGRERASRAWTAGQWARAVLDSRIHSPNRTPPLDLRSRLYAIARADGVGRFQVFSILLACHRLT